MIDWGGGEGGLLLLLRPEGGPQHRHRRLPVPLPALPRELGAARGAAGAAVWPATILEMLRVNPRQSVGALRPGLVALARLAEVGLAVGPTGGQATGVLARVVADVV